MTLQLAVRITGDASSLKQAAGEAKTAATGITGAIEVSGTEAAAAFDKVTQAAGKAEAAASAATRAINAEMAAGKAAENLANAARNAAAGRPAGGPSAPSVPSSPAPGAPAPTSAPAPSSPKPPTPSNENADLAKLAAGLRAQLDPLGAALDRYNARLEQLKKLQTEGYITATQLAGGIKLADKELKVASQGGGGFRSDQWKNLGFQANDIVTSLASGAPVTQVIAQQGGQVAQVLGDAPGGIAGGLKIVASRAMEILTPLRLVTAGFAGLAAGVAYLGITWARSQEEIRIGLLGIGVQSRATVADINRIAEAAAAGGKIGRGDARGIAAAVAGTGKVDVSNIPAVVNLAPGYAKLFGKDLTDTGADLARIFSDPVKGAEELNARIGGLDAGTRRYIATLVDQGSRQEAVRATVRAFAPDLEAAAEKTSLWAKAWGLLGTVAEGAGRLIAKPFVDGTLQEQLAAARKELAGLEYQREAGTGFDAAGQIPAIQARIAELTSKLDEEAAAPGKKASAELSKQADAAILAIQPEIDQLAKLNNAIVLLGKTQNDFDAIAGLSAEARKQLTDALEAAKGGVDSFMQAEDKARASEALTMRSIEARTVVEKAAIAAERERISLAGQAVSADDRRQRVEAARQAVLAQSTRESQDRLRSANDNAASAGLLSYPRQLAELEAKYREVFKADTGNLPAIANDQKAKAAERSAIDQQAIGGPMRDANRSLAEQVAALKLQQDAFGASTEAAARMAAAQQLVNTYTAAGIPISADLKRAIDAYAASVGKRVAAEEDLVRRQREVVGGLDDVRSSLRGGMTGIFSDVASGKSPLDGIVSSLNRTASSIFDRTVSGPLTASLFGQEGKAGGGIFGDALGGIFGKAAGLPKADITAGIVNVTGPVSGIPGLTAANGNVPSASSVAAGLGGTSSAEAASGILSRLSGSRSEVAEYVRQAAIQRGIDPNVALRVVNQESGFNAGAQNLTSRESSYGVMQLNTMGGLGADALKAGIDVRDPSTWRQQVDFGLDTVKRDGWRQWYGARDIGVSRWEGVGQGAPANTATSATNPVSGLDASLQQVNTSATAASQGVASLGSDLTSLPGPLAQTSQGLSQVGQSLGSGSGGGGLLGALASLFSGGGASVAAPATVTAAAGGHIRGPGTSTSDSIAAWLSDGEFVVNAGATKKNLSLLHAINDNRMPAFAEGGYVGAMPAMARREDVERREAAAGPAQGGATAPVVHIHDNVGVEKKTTSRTERGQSRMDVFLDNAVADVLSRPGSQSGKALSTGWGLSRALARRA